MRPAESPCNDRPSQVSVAPYEITMTDEPITLLATIAQVRFPLHPLGDKRCVRRNRLATIAQVRFPLHHRRLLDSRSIPSCNDRPSQVSVAPYLAIIHLISPNRTCNDRPSQVSVAPHRSLAARTPGTLVLQRSPKSGFRCTRIQHLPEQILGTCNDRPSQVSVAPDGELDRGLQCLHLQRSPKSGFRCHQKLDRIAPGSTACNDRPSQVSVAPRSQKVSWTIVSGE